MGAVVLWGPPCAGKSTYINERAKPGDIVIDLDAIAHAVAPADEPYAYSDQARDIAREMRLHVIDWTVRLALRTDDWTAWVVDSNATPSGLGRWRRMGAEVVELDTPRAICIERAASERPHGYPQRVDAWFETHHGRDFLGPDQG